MTHPIQLRLAESTHTFSWPCRQASVLFVTCYLLLFPILVYFTLFLFKLFCWRLFFFSLHLTQQQISAVVAHPPALKIGCVVCVCVCVRE